MARKDIFYARAVAVCMLAILVCRTCASEKVVAPVEGLETRPSMVAVGVEQLGIKNGTVVSSDFAWNADIYIEGGVIKRVAPSIEFPPGTRVIDASGSYVLPGGIDPHVHWEMPFMATTTVDDYYTGTAAALAGGTTMTMDFPIPQQNESLVDLYERYLKIGAKAAGDYSFHIVVKDWTPEISRDMGILVKEKGISSFKLFMAYKDALMVTDEQLFKAFVRCAELGAVPMVHAENGDMIVQKQKLLLSKGVVGPEGHPQSRPPEVEAEATHRATVTAAMAQSPVYVVHVMSKDAMEEIARARQRGHAVVGEAVLAGLTLDESIYFGNDFLKAAIAVMSPPLRPKGHAESLLAALKAGVLSLVGTDHCAFNSSQKLAGKGDFTKIPNGITGAEDRMKILWHVGVSSGILSPSDFVRITSTTAAKIFGMYPQKGVIAEGSDADIVIINPNGETNISAKSHHQNVDHNVYDGWRVTCEISHTILRGRVVFEEGKLSAERGYGRFVPCKPFGSLYTMTSRLYTTTSLKRQE